MNKLTLENVFLVMLQLPLSAVLFACAFAEKHFTRWMIVIENPLSHPMTDLANKRAKDKRGTASIEKDKPLAVARKIITQDHYRAFNGWLTGNNDYFIARLRVNFEAKYANLMAEGRRRDPHLYAVLKPTRSENIVRIGNVFRVLAPTTQAAIIATALAVKGCSGRP